MSDDGRDDLRGYSKKIRLGIFRSLDAHRYFSLIVVMHLAGCISMKMFLVSYEEILNDVTWFDFICHNFVATHLANATPAASVSFMFQ